MDFQFNCHQIITTADYDREISVSVSGVHKGDLLDHFTLKDIINHFGQAELLDAIGEERAKEFFNLKEKE